VVALGKPLRYQQNDIAVGDVVIWHKVHTVPVKINGKELLAARREYVTCKVAEVAE
jgi:co-chaperonin GroES (HSP10)